MSQLSFEWDKRKSTSNFKKHGISFEEAKTVFLDECARVIPDDDSSQVEERFVILGLSQRLRLLTICHCYRNNEEIIRIISARKATLNESKVYRSFLS